MNKHEVITKGKGKGKKNCKQNAISWLMTTLCLPQTAPLTNPTKWVLSLPLSHLPTFPTPSPLTTPHIYITSHYLSTVIFPP